MSYVLCGTPRTGSTLLCNLLTSTGRLGRPQSYFREPDEATWARRFGLPTDGSRVVDYGLFVQAIRAAGSTSNGVFAARIMWGSLDRVIAGLGRAPGESERRVLQRVFGPLRFVHLRRVDTVAQAVSWCRAEQTGYWQDGDVALGSSNLDLDRMKNLVGTIRDHNDSWQDWFTRNRIEPVAVTYEEVVRDPRSTIERIASGIGVEIPARWRADAPDRRQADGINAKWAVALRAALDP